MRSLSKRLIRSSQVILNDKKFVLSTKVKPKIDPIENETVAPSDTEASEPANVEEGPAMPTISKEDIEDMLEQANQDVREILGRAESDSEQIISEAYENAKGILEQAKQDGYTAGYEEAVQAGQHEAQQIIADALQIKEQAVQQYKDLLVNAEPEVVELVLDTIETILRKRVEEDRDVIEGLIHSALEKCAYTDNLTLRVSVEDYDYAISIRDRILALSENLDTITIKHDSSLVHGSCVIDTSAGSVDSSVWTQFEQIRATFKELLQSE